MQTCCCLQSSAVILLSTEPCCWICFNMSTELFSWTHYCQQSSAIKSATGYRAMQLNLLRCLRSRDVKYAAVYRAVQLNLLLSTKRCSWICYCLQSYAAESDDVSTQTCSWICYCLQSSAVESATVYRAVQLNLLLSTELCSWIS